jgi:polyphosphate kinase
MDALSPVIEELKSAAKTKKRVRVIIELRARFDEMNNLRLAEDLRKSGVEVAFGFGQLKVHAKVALVTRQEKDGERLYTHLSTGNYNAATARAYEDLAILTARPTFGEDARLFFDAVCRGQVPTGFKTIVPAPARLHRLLLQLIEAETAAAQAGRPASLFAKVNALVDEGIIESLYRASQAGVRVNLMVRGACSLIPGVKGLSDNIRVLSIVDRFLEHSRIFYFGDSNRMYLSSADWMPRNFFSRLEVAFPILDDRLQHFIRDVVIPIYLSDTVKARELTPQGTWRKRATSVSHSIPDSLRLPAPVRAQSCFEDLARRAYRGTPLCRETLSI